jgi:hypothetical protein
MFHAPKESGCFSRNLQKSFRKNMTSAYATPAHTPHTNCPNCNASLGNAPGKFCANCGQETQLEPLTFTEFVAEFLGHYVAPAGKLAKTLWRLFAKPGQLTLDYREGRRNQFVRPMRLLFTIAILALVLSKGTQLLFPQSEMLVGKQIARMEAEAREAQIAEERAKPAPDVVKLARLAKPLPADIAESYVKQTRILEAMQLYLMLINAPLAALAYWLMFWRRPYLYGDYLVFALHTSCAFTLLYAVAKPLLTMAGAGFVAHAVLMAVLTIWWLIYMFFSLRRAYTGTIFSTTVRLFLAIAAAYALPAITGYGVAKFVYPYFSG